MVNLEEYNAYFEAIATAFKPIGHLPANDIIRFASFSTDDIIQKKREKGGLDYSHWCMTVIEPDIELRKNNSSQYRNTIQAGFEIVINPGRDKTQTLELQAAALLYCQEIVAYLIKQRKRNTFTLGLLEDSAFEYYLQTAVFDKYVGAGVSFEYTLGFAQSKTINTDNWL
jgi:hypothetical protein